MSDIKVKVFPHHWFNEIKQLLVEVHIGMCSGSGTCLNISQMSC